MPGHSYESYRDNFAVVQVCYDVQGCNWARILLLSLLFHLRRFNVFIDSEQNDGYWNLSPASRPPVLELCGWLVAYNHVSTLFTLSILQGRIHKAILAKDVS